MARVAAERRRQDLTEAAFRVMSRVGVSAATTRLIAEEAGVPQSLFHYCFKSKDELLQQLTRVVVSSMAGDALDSFVESDSFEESVRRSLRQWLQNAIDEPERQLVLYELTTAALREPNGLDLARWQYEQYFLNTKQLLLALEAKGGVAWQAPIDVLSRLTTTMIDGLILGWCTDHDTPQAESTLDLFAAQLASLATSRGS